MTDELAKEAATNSDIKECYIQGPPKKCIHTLTKENSALYNRLL